MLKEGIFVFFGVIYASSALCRGNGYGKPSTKMVNECRSDSSFETVFVIFIEAPNEIHGRFLFPGRMD